MAKRNRYRELEAYMTRVLLADAGVFVLCMIFGGLGWTALKVICGIVAILASLLCLGYLYMTGELLKKRSRWMTTGAAAVLICTLVTLILNYPGK